MAAQEFPFSFRTSITTDLIMFWRSYMKKNISIRSVIISLSLHLGVSLRQENICLPGENPPVKIWAWGTWDYEWGLVQQAEVVSGQGGVSLSRECVQRDNIPHSQHLVDDRVGVGHGLSAAVLGCCDWPSTLSISAWTFSEKSKGGSIILFFHNSPWAWLS